MHRHRQLHLWISENDYLSLREMASERRETLSSVIRQLIKGRGVFSVDAGRVSQAEAESQGREPTSLVD
jgi:hypothetical protein